MDHSVIDHVSPNLLFRHRIPCQSVKQGWSKKGLPLDESHQLPAFGTFEGQSRFADFRMGWSAKGLFFDVTVSGKTQSLWCRTTQILESDRVMVFVDTRNTQSIHRASRFCHWFVYLPSGVGAQNDSPGGTMLKINRAKEDPKSFAAFKPYAVCKTNRSGYRIQFFIADVALTGWDSGEHRQIGFNYVVFDREKGEQSLASGSDLPTTSDPSLWHQLQLID